MLIRMLRNFLLTRHTLAPFVDEWVRGSVQLPMDTESEIQVSIALDLNEIRAAIELLNRSYKELGYINAEERLLEINKYIAQPDAAVLIAKLGDTIIGTLTVVQRNAMRLPAEDAFSLDTQLAATERAGEFTCLVVEPRFRRRQGFQATFLLMRYAYWLSVNRFALDKIFVVCQPEHVAFYRGLFGFRLIEGKNTVNDYKGSPAACVLLDVIDAQTHMRNVMSRRHKTKSIADFFFRCPQGLQIRNFSHVPASHQPTWSSKKLELLLSTGDFALSQMSLQDRKKLAAGYFDSRLNRLLNPMLEKEGSRRHRRHLVMVDAVAMDANTQNLTFGIARNISWVAFEFVSQKEISAQANLFFKLDFADSTASYVRARILRAEERVNYWIYVVAITEADEAWTKMLKLWEQET